MKTLFPEKVNWTIFMGLCILIRVLFLGISWASYFAIILSLHQFFLLYTSIGYVIPVRYLFGAFMCLQFFIGPTLAYNGLDQYQYKLYKMQIGEAEYFSYAIPAVISFIMGLHIAAGNLDGETINQKGLRDFVKINPKIPYIFIILGFFSSILSEFFSSELAFVFYVLGSFKFIGLFLLIMSDSQLKLAPLVLVVGSIIVSSLGNGMFHDLLTWLIFLGAVYAIKYQPGNNIKLIASVGFIFLSVVIQQLKGDYRSATNVQGQTGGIETFTKTYEAKSENNSLFSFESLAPSNVRINQGFIITNVMKTVPDRVPFSNGEEMRQVLEAAILPRFLAPNKLNAGDREIFIKYSGIKLRSGTSMALSSLGDAYLNFGKFGGSVFMFGLGLFYCMVLNLFHKRSAKQPVLILFTCILFYYPIRPDCELQTILGHLVKSTFIILAMVYFWRNIFRDQSKMTFESQPLALK